MTPTLSDVMPSAAAALGVPGFTDSLGLGPSRHVVVVLIDGLGALQLRDHRDRAPALSAMTSLVGMDTGLQASFPTTTPVGLASLGTGLSPGSHGFVGASFLLPETGHILAPLHWGSTPTPVAVQPEATVFERVTRAGSAAVTIAPAAYQDSGLTRAVLRGAEYLSAEDSGQRALALREQLQSDTPTLAYVYWAELDRTGHEFGIASSQWESALAQADAMVAALVETLPSSTTLVVTADHGMVDCPDDRRVNLDVAPGLNDGVIHVAGEPRMRHLYTRAGAAADVAATWRHELAGRCDVHTRQELMDSGLLGAVDPDLAGRVGDVVAVARDDWMLTSHVDTRVSSLRGQHGAGTPQERMVPALVHRR